MAYLSNNPFVDESSSAAARFPSINGYGSPSPPQAAGSQYTGWAQPGYSAQSPPPQQQFGTQPTGYQQQYQAQQQFGQPTGYGLTSPVGASQGQQSGFFPQQQQQPQQQFAPQPTGYGGSGFGQPQIQSQPSYSGYGQQQQGYGFQQQPTGYGGGYQQQQPQPYGGNGNLAAFDPYANSSQFQQQQPQQQSGQFPSASTPAGGAAPPGQEHPRQYVQAHKAELEQWDQIAWKQATNAFDALAAAWEARKRLVDMRIQQLGSTPGAAGGFFGGQQQGYGGYGGYNPQAQEVERLNGLAKEAENNVGTVYAAKFQMTEVQGSYRHSTDAASKRRVREATNAALTNLPDWPPANF
ncbi:unnamed protein product [Peniophora sp. CBMAI 1063]|nr:unnamed protein product [Peniophora sp. CBMAI 1063]